MALRVGRGLIRIKTHLLYLIGIFPIETLLYFANMSITHHDRQIRSLLYHFHVLSMASSHTPYKYDDEIYKFFEILNQNGHQLLGYTIMPNHIRFLLYFKKQKQPLNTMIGSGKLFIGYEVIKRLERQQQHLYSKMLSEPVNPCR